MDYTSVSVCVIINLLITTKGTGTCRLAFTSNTEQFVAHNRHNIFNLKKSVKETIYLGILGLILDSRCKGFSR